MTDVLFYIFASLIAISSLMVVTSRNLVRAAMSLIATLFFTAALYILLQAEFVAIAQVLVYIGGVVVFVVFTILLTTRLGDKYYSPRMISRFIGGLVVVEILAFLFYLYHRLPDAYLFKATREIAPLKEIGKRLMSTESSGMLVPFEIISLLLLASLIGAVTIARMSPTDSKEGVK